MKIPNWLNIFILIITLITFIVNNRFFKQNFPMSFYIMVLCIVFIFIFLPRLVLNSSEKVKTTLIHNVIINTGTNVSWTSILISIAIIPVFFLKYDLKIKIIVSSVLFLIGIIYWVYNFSKPIEEKRKIVEEATSNEVMSRVRKRQPINFAIVCITMVVFGILYYTEADQNLFVLIGSFIAPLILLAFYKPIVNSF